MKHYVIAIALLAVALAMHHSIRMTQAQAVDRAAEEYVLEVPSRLGEYRQYGEDQEVDERTQRVLETSNILIRNYLGRQNWPVQLTIVHAGATRRSLHFPEVCIVGAGWEIREQTTVPIGIMFEARKLVLVRGDQREAVLYWFKTDDHLTGNFFINSFNWARYQVTHGTTPSAMIRVSTMVGPMGEDATFDMLKDFAAQATPILLDTVP